MKILYHYPSLYSISAGRTIYYGYKHAFEDMGHEFNTLTSKDNLEHKISQHMPDIFISSLSDYSLKYLDLQVFNKARARGMKAYMSTHFWNSAFSRMRMNEPKPLSQDHEKVALIKTGELGDVFFNSCEQGDMRMNGFKKATGYAHTTILLAADKTVLYPDRNDKFISDICYIGTYLPGKRKFFNDIIYPLRNKYIVSLYGQDWTFTDRTLGNIQKVGQYFNINSLAKIRKSKLELSDERKIYTSSLISINVHEDYQKRSLGDLNERTFKIPLCGGFEIVDFVPSLVKYFEDGSEIVIAKTKKDWQDKIEYYLSNPDQRKTLINKGRNKVLKMHTYHNRVKQMIDIYNKIK